MPEGPEARTIADKLHQFIVNKYLIDVESFTKAKVTGMIPRKLQINRVWAYGKKIIFDLGYPVSHQIICSLGMTGKFILSETTHSKNKFTYGSVRKFKNIEIVTRDGVFYFDDVRGFGNIIMGTLEEQSVNYNKLGYNLLEHALTISITSEQWKNTFNLKSKRSIGDYLLDQDKIAGIGNYLTSEICYDARISPLRIISSLTDEELERLRISSHKIIKISYEAGGHTIENFTDLLGDIGRYETSVYGKELDPNGYTIIKVKNNRTRYYVPELQA